MDRMRSRARELRNEATNAERHLWRHLKLKQLAGFRFRRQVPISNYVVDFVCPRIRLIVELDGGHHAERGGPTRRAHGRLRLTGIVFCATGTTMYCCERRMSLTTFFGTRKAPLPNPPLRYAKGRE